MKRLNIALLILACGMLLFNTAWSADRWSPAQKEVWATEEKMWELGFAKDADAFLAMIHKDYVGWSYDLPVPSDRASTDKWLHYQWGNAEWTNEIYDLAPLEIVVNGNTGVCFYYYFTVTKDKEGKPKDHEGRWVDVFVKDGGKWMLIADHGGSTEDDEGDD